MQMRFDKVINLGWHWMLGALFYWWLVTKLQPQQLGAAVVVGGVVATALVVLEARAKIRLAVEWRWVAFLIRRLPAKVIQDLCILAGVLFRSLFQGHRGTGAFHAKPFDPGGADAKSAGRRALVLASVSLSPNTFAISIEDDGLLHVHQLVFRTGSENEKWPI